MTHSPTLSQLFKEQLENEARQLAETQGIQDRGPALQRWYLTRLVGLSPTEADEMSCDGPNDLGIDAVWVGPDDIVHFYQFKNPERTDVALPTVEVDKVLAGLTLILNRRHREIANPDLRELVDNIYQLVPTGYRIHLVTSGTGLNTDARTKLDTFISGLGAQEGFFSWVLEDLPFLQDCFYQKTLPTVEAPIELTLDQSPYPVRSAAHDSYLFHLSGAVLAALYETHGEQLLQQNIRVYQGDRATNAVIRRSCTGNDSARFFHYNNGVTFLCETASWDAFTRKLTLSRAQVVNGGQTVRVLHDASRTSALKADVLVPIRVITSQGNRDFANNVAVNLNNQNRIEPSFLRSNDPRIIQLANSLASLGWFLERREDEAAQFTANERSAAETRIGRGLAGRIISLKGGMQAYVATFLRQPELAKKNPKRIFLGPTDGGSFDRVFGPELTADRIVAAQRLTWFVDEHVRQFMTRKRRKQRVADWRRDYRDLLGDDIMNDFGDIVDQVIPQCAVFLAAILFERSVRIEGATIDRLLQQIEAGDHQPLNRALCDIMRYARQASQFAGQSWPTLLKSQTFFDNLASFLQGAQAAG